MNNRKLMLQKKFLEKQLAKDSAEVSLEMNKIQIEIQQEGATHMLNRFKQVYQCVADQSTYIRQIVGFMDFDKEIQTGSVGVTTVTYEDVVKEINENVQKPSVDGVESPVGVLTEDDCLQNYPYETLGVVVQMLNDCLKEADVKPGDGLKKLGELLAGRSAGPAASEIYEKYLHQTKVHFQQQLYQMSDQLKQLETTNKKLSLKVQRATLDMKKASEGRGTASPNDAWKRRQTFEAQGSSPIAGLSSGKRGSGASDAEEEADFSLS